MPEKHIIDLDSPPFIPDGWSVEQHTPDGMFTWDPEKVTLFLSPNQERGDYPHDLDQMVVPDYDLEKMVLERNPFNANLLDYLLRHPDIIPEDWKEKWVCFWGTIYCDHDGFTRVRYLYWYDGHWHWDHSYTHVDFHESSPAAIPV